MKTLDSLSREALLRVLKILYDLESTIAGNKAAAQDAQSQINYASADYQRKLKAAGRGKRILGAIILFYAFFYVPGLLYLVVALLIPAIPLDSLGLSEIPSTAQPILGIVLAIVLAGLIALPIALLKSGKKARMAFIKSGVVEQLNAYIAEQQALIAIYNGTIAGTSKKLNESYAQYCVRPELRSSAALLFCYNEVYHSSNIGIDTAFQRYLAKVHRDSQLALQQQQNEEIKLARQQAHNDAVASYNLAKMGYEADRREAAAQAERDKRRENREAGFVG